MIIVVVGGGKWSPCMHLANNVTNRPDSTTWVAVAGRKQTEFLLFFDDFF